MTTNTAKVSETSQYATIKQLLDTNDIERLKGLVRDGWLQQQIWEGESYKSYLSVEEFLLFIYYVAGGNSVSLPRTLINMITAVINNNINASFEAFMKNKSTADLLSAILLPRDVGLFYADNIDEVMPQLNDDFFRKLFTMPNIRNFIAKTNFFKDFIRAKPDSNLFELMPHDLRPYISFLPDDKYSKHFKIAIESWFPDLPDSSLRCLNYLHNEIYPSTIWGDCNSLKTYLQLVEEDSSIIEDMNTIAGKYFYDNVLRAFKLLTLYTTTPFRKELLDFPTTQNDLIKKLNVLTLLPKLPNIQSLSDLLNIDLIELAKLVTPPEKKSKVPARDPDADKNTGPLFEHLRAIATIDINGNFIEHFVGNSHFTIIDQLYHSIIPNGEETEEFKQYEALARNGYITFCINGNQASIFIPSELTNLQYNSFISKISNTSSGFDFYANIYGKDYAQQLADGYEINKIDLLLFVELFCKRYEPKKNRHL